MRGSRTRIGENHWRLRVYVGRQAAAGGPVQASRNFRGTAKEADRELRKLVAEVEEGRWVPERATVGQLLDRWLDQVATRATAYTVRGYRYLIDAGLKPDLGDVRVSKVSARTLDDLYRRWLAAGVSPASVRKRHQLLSAAFRQAVKWELVGRAPTDRATPPKSAGRELERVISVAELQELVRACEDDDPMLGCAAALAALTGCRRGELCALRWSDFFLDTGLMVVGRSLTVLDGEVMEGETKTHQRRPVALDPVAVAVVERRMGEQRARAAWDGGSLVGDPWLLSRRADGGAPCLPAGLSHGFRRVAASLGLPYHLHELRHFAVSMMLANGVDPVAAARRAGHRRVTMTLDVYGKLVSGSDRSAAEVLGRLLGPAAVASSGEGGR